MSQIVHTGLSVVFSLSLELTSPLLPSTLNQPTQEPTWDEAHLGLPTYEPTLDSTEESTSEVSEEATEETGLPTLEPTVGGTEEITSEVSEEATEETTNVASQDASEETTSKDSEQSTKDGLVTQDDLDFENDFSISTSYAHGSTVGTNVDFNRDGFGGSDGDREGSSFFVGGRDISSFSAAQGARQRRRRVYRNRRRVLRRSDRSAPEDLDGDF